MGEETYRHPWDERDVGEVAVTSTSKRQVRVGREGPWIKENCPRAAPGWGSRVPAKTEGLQGGDCTGEAADRPPATVTVSHQSDRSAKERGAHLPREVYAAQAGH